MATIDLDLGAFTPLISLKSLRTGRTKSYDRVKKREVEDTYKMGMEAFKGIGSVSGKGPGNIIAVLGTGICSGQQANRVSTHCWEN